MLEFEPILLKKLIKCGDFFGKVMPIIKTKHFEDVGNKELFGMLKEYYSQYRSIPTTTELVAKVKDVSNVETRNSIVKSLQTIKSTDEVDNTEFMIEETISWVKDAMYLEALQIGSDGLMKKDDALKLKAQAIMDERAKVSVDSDLGLDFDDIDAMIEYYSLRQAGIKTSHKQLNKRLGPGFLPGTLSVILAASGVGKSLMMTDLISGMIKDNKNILLVSLEMADKEIMKRVHANALDLPINSLIDLAKTEGELAQMTRPTVSKQDVLAAYNKVKIDGNVGKLFVKDYPAGSFSPLMLEQLVESYKIEKNITFDIIFVDYIGIMRSDLVSPSAGLYSYVKSIAEETRASAKKLGVPIISASQLNRCFSVDTMINTLDGVKAAGDILKSDVVESYIENNEVLEVTKPEKMKAYKITTQSGKTIICSGNHKFPTPGGIMTVNVGLEKGVKLSTKKS